MNLLRKYRNLLIFTGIMFLTVILELAMHSLNVKDENIYLVFVLAILIIIIEFKNIYYGLLASLITVFSFDYFITEPRFSFVVDDTNNYVSFIMLIVVTFMVNSLVIRLQNQIRISRRNEDKVNALYQFSSDFLNAQNNEEIIHSLYEGLRRKIEGKISILTLKGKCYGDEQNSDEVKDAMRYALSHHIPVDKDTPGFSGFEKTVFPVQSSVKDYGVIVISYQNKDEVYDRTFVENVVEELVVALDKNTIRLEEETTRLAMEKEKFKSSILRALSHDLKTPLTMIQSGSDLLSENYEDIDDEAKKALIRDIYDESCDLSVFVNNLLDMTRLESDKVSLNRTKEPVDDILFEVSEKVKRRNGQLPLSISYPEEVVTVDADVNLLIQVFLNLIDNALRHTKKGTKVHIKVLPEEGGVSFEVSDNGGGIAKEKLPGIFEDFYSLSVNQDRRRSHGLGLSICKAIVEAHGGHIEAFNNEEGGATFRFNIPEKGE